MAPTFISTSDGPTSRFPLRDCVAFSIACQKLLVTVALFAEAGFPLKSKNSSPPPTNQPKRNLISFFILFLCIEIKIIP